MKPAWNIQALRAGALAAALGAAAAAGSAGAQSQALPPPDRPGAVSEQAPEYRILPQDVLEVTVLQAPELSRSVSVDNKGDIALPFLGELSVAGKTTQQVTEELASVLNARIMKDPQVTVRVSEAQGQKVTVDGAVSEPGVYPLRGPMSLLQVVALAKGPDPRLANERRVAVFRSVGGARRMAMFDLRAIRRGQATDPIVYGGDIVVVDTSGTKSFLQSYQPTFGLVGMMFRPW